MCFCTSRIHESFLAFQILCFPHCAAEAECYSPARRGEGQREPSHSAIRMMAPAAVVHLRQPSGARSGGHGGRSSNFLGAGSSARQVRRGYRWDGPADTRSLRSVAFRWGTKSGPPRTWKDNAIC